MHDRKPWSKRKPYSRDAGYVASHRCRLGGWIIVYDRKRQDPCACVKRESVPGCEVCDGTGLVQFWCDTGDDHRWVVMHMPSSRHVGISGRDHAREIMVGIARAETHGEALLYADILPDSVVD